MNPLSFIRSMLFTETLALVKPAICTSPTTSFYQIFTRKHPPCALCFIFWPLNPQASCADPFTFHRHTVSLTFILKFPQFLDLALAQATFHECIFSSNASHSQHNIVPNSFIWKHFLLLPLPRASFCRISPQSSFVPVPQALLLPYSFFFKNIFTYLKSRESSLPSMATLQVAVITGVGPGQNQEPGASSRSLLWVQGWK